MKVKDIIFKAISERTSEKLAQSIINELGRDINYSLNCILNYGGGDVFPYFSSMTEFVNNNLTEIYNYLEDYVVSNYGEDIAEFLIKLVKEKEDDFDQRQDLYRFLAGNKIEGDPSGWIIGILVFEEVAFALEELLTALEDKEDDDEVDESELEDLY